MPNPVNSILVLIASPGNAKEERATVRDALNDWSVNNGSRQGIVLLPWLYERHAVAGFGERAQALINTQAVDKADVVVAFFDSRLGTDTGVDVSGTAEEIHRASELGKPVHIYFSSEPFPRDTDLDQLTKLNEFKGTLKDRALLGDYTGPGDLAAQIERALQDDIDKNGWGDGLLATRQTGVQLSWEHESAREQSGIDSRGKTKMRTLRSILVVKNSSGVDAESFIFTVRPAAGSEEQSFHCNAPEDPVTLHAHAERQWPLLVGSSMTLQIDARWNERLIPRSMTTTIITR